MRYLILTLLLVVFSVEARMYQWVDAETGTTQLSGKPPSWYRNGEAGPRVFVFDSGKIVDDTGVKVSEEHRALLRERAYDIANEESIRARAEAIQAMKEKQLATDKAEDEEEYLEDEEVEVAEAESQPEDGEDSVEKIEEKKLTELSLDDMKKLIQDWDSQQADKAKEILNQ